MEFIKESIKSYNLNKYLIVVCILENLFILKIIKKSARKKNKKLTQFKIYALSYINAIKLALFYVLKWKQ